MRRLDRSCSRDPAAAAAAAAKGSAAFRLSPAPALLAIPEPAPMPGGPTAYGGTKPGPAAGGGADAGTEVASVPAGAAGAGTGAGVGAPRAPTAAGLLVTWGNVDDCAGGAGASTGTGADSGWIAASAPRPPRPPAATAGTINGTARTSGKACTNSIAWPNSSDASPPTSATNWVNPWPGFCSMRPMSLCSVCVTSVIRLMYQLRL